MVMGMLQVKIYHLIRENSDPMVYYLLTLHWKSMGDGSVCNCTILCQRQTDPSPLTCIVSQDGSVWLARRTPKRLFFHVRGSSKNQGRPTDEKTVTHHGKTEPRFADREKILSCA